MHFRLQKCHFKIIEKISNFLKGFTHDFEQELAFS